MEEEWKQITDYENYSISNFGSVKNNLTNRILKPKIVNKYYMIDLCKNGTKKPASIHRLVGLYFLEKVEEKETIDHIDRNKTNNHISNLRWATKSEQQKNKNKSKNCLSKWKGVTFDKQKNKWKCHMRIDGKLKHIGYFDNEIDCAKKYNEYIIENNLGEFYVLNDF